MLVLALLYTFHLKLTDGRTALLANPQLKTTPAQLERAANDQVLLFDHGKGAHWYWMMLSWKTDVEQGVNARGGADPKKDADIGFTPKTDGKIRIRCLRDECKVGKVSLKNGESIEVEPDVDVSVATRP
jgi:hypothetical protein